MKLIIASRNVHKIRELRLILKQLMPSIDVYSLIDFPNYAPPHEEGHNFAENATLKATHAAQTLGHYSLGDDSGLVVPALGGAPGIYSARYAGPHATDKENRKKLLKEMATLKDQQRAAYYECALALAAPEGLKKCVSALCEGMILEEERGCQGFGYDPIFMKFEYSKSFGETEEEVKNRISHRRKAVDKLLYSLESLVSAESKQLI